MGMRRELIYSAILHVAVALLVIFGLPHFLDDEVISQPTMVVEMVQVADKTNPPPSQALREEPPKPAPPKPPEDKPPPPQAKPTPPPPPVPEPPKPQVAEKPPEPLPKPPEPKPEVKPEPKPEPKPEVKKEPPPKETPPPPRQVAKIVPPKKPPPRRDDFINSILKDVAPTPRAQEKTDAKPKPQKDTTPRPSPAPPSLDQQVTISEIDAVRRQIQACWSIPAGARDAKDLIVTIRATVAPDGRVQSARIDDMSRMSDPFYRAAAESAQRAVLNPRCQPLKLPPHKYEQWKELRLDFNPKDMIG